ncbi:MAG TPA: 3-methyl-2-oxobutanoate hydroxymethyltransferase [Gemmatimonadaceae bacterium]|nr:3-methyl-2-oxobutanoate hydroxymethyltransferase [Gemmatimonadaceae bacterium]
MTRESLQTIRRRPAARRATPPDAPPPAAPPPAAPPERKVTVVTLARWAREGRRAVCLTAYDHPTAVFAERAGVDVLLVGDSAAMTMLGHRTTLGVTMTEMLVFARAVCRGARRAFVIGDLPFLSYQVCDADAVRHAGAFIAAGCDAVKCEGGARVAARVQAMTDAGIAVMGHLGLTPQSQAQLGGYRVQGKSLDAARRVAEDAHALERAGAFAILLEAMPAAAAAYVRAAVTIPVYGIGAGPELDGQLVISHDLLGTFVGEINPRFVRRYADVDVAIEHAFRSYGEDVRAGRFPAAPQCYAIDVEAEAAIRSATAARTAARSPVRAIEHDATLEVTP